MDVFFYTWLSNRNKYIDTVEWGHVFHASSHKRSKKGDVH